MSDAATGEQPKKKIRRRYKVDLLPGHVQGVIFRGFVSGEAYWKIRKAAKELGHDISENALSRYWRNVWQNEIDFIRKARAYKEALKEALQLDPQSKNGQIAEELLYDIVFNMLRRIEEEDPLDLLREAREQQKSSPKDAKPVPEQDSSPVAQGREIRRRWRQLYGLEPADEEPKETDSNE